MQFILFKGTIHYENFDSKGNLVNEDEKEAITPENVLLRGCTLRNTKWVIGFCIYTGQKPNHAQFWDHTNKDISYLS